MGDDSLSAVAALAAKPYAQSLFGVALEDVSPGTVTIRIEQRPSFGHQPGWFQGAVTSAAGEYAASWSTMTLTPADWTTLTIEQSIRFISPAKGDRLIAVGRVISSSRSISIGAADIYVEHAGTRTLCAVLTLTNRHRPPRPA